MRSVLFSILLTICFVDLASAQFSVKKLNGEKVAIVEVSSDVLDAERLTLGGEAVYDLHEGRGFYLTNPKIIGNNLVFKFLDSYQEKYLDYCQNAPKHRLFLTSTSDGRLETIAMASQDVAKSVVCQGK